MNPTNPAPFSSYQKFVIAILAFLQFTIILDFMILSPLGAILMPALKITPAQFGMVVSVYAFSAGISGILAAGFADRYDRKKLLLFFYTGFVAGTFLCGIAPSYIFLLLARMITGIFGGVLGSIVAAIITDVFSYDQRGRVMGFIQTAFAASQILGLPIGLYFSNLWGWHFPCMMIVAISSVAGLIIYLKLKPIDEHLKLQGTGNAIDHFKATVANKNYIPAYFATALLSIGGFMMMPFGSAFTVNNLKIDLDHLPMIYLVTGCASIVMGPLIGKFSDKFGKFNVFTAGSLLSAVTVLIYTNLGATPLIGVLLINIVMFTGIFSRMIPSQAMMSAIPAAANRGAFMSISSSLQQIAGGFAAILGGLLIVQQGEKAPLEHFERLGYVMVGTVLISLALMYSIQKSIAKKVANP